MKTCPGCETRIRDDILCCDPCWNRVPTNLPDQPRWRSRRRTARSRGGSYAWVIVDQIHDAVLTWLAANRQGLRPPEHHEEESAVPDELDDYIKVSSENPDFRHAYEDAATRARVTDELLAARRGQSLTQTAVATRMGIQQPTVSQFEAADSDPRISTLQRYARAVGMQVVITLEGDGS